MSALQQPLLGFVTRFPYGMCKNPVVAAGATDALPVADANVFITRAGVDAMTLAAPKAGVYQAGSNLIQSLGDPQDDGKTLFVISTTAFAHTITAPAGKMNGTLHLATFAGAIGNFVEFKAFNGIWYISDLLGVVIS
jgi:hypothetical protein